MLARNRSLLAVFACSLAFAGGTGAAFAAQAATPVKVGLKVVKENTLKATVGSGKKKCTRGRLVEFFSKKDTPGDTWSQIGAEYTDNSGQYTSGLLGEGRYYVKVRPETKKGTKCGGGRSAVVRIKLDF